MKIEEIRKYWDIRAKNFELLLKLPLLSTLIKNRDKILEEMLDIKKDDVILDVGAGTCRFTLLLSPKVKKIVAIDVSSEMLKIAKSKAKCHGTTNIEFKNISIQDFETDIRFDKILSAGVFQFVDDIKEILEKFYYLLRPGGRVVFNITDKKNVFSVVYVLSSRLIGINMKLYSAQEIVDMLHEIGYKEIVVHTSKDNFFVLHSTISADKIEM